MMRPHTKPSRNLRTAKVDHRGSGRNFLWKNIRFRRSAISQKRISCETFFKLNRKLLHQHHLRYHLHCGNDPAATKHNGIPSATHPPAPHAIPFTLRERSCSYKSHWNSVYRTCTKTRETPCIMRNRSDHDPPMIRTWSADDPTTYETVSQLSHRKGRSSKFGDALCLEKHKVS